MSNEKGSVIVIIISIISALGAAVSAIYAWQSFELTKLEVDKLRLIAADNMLDQLSSEVSGDSCLKYFDALYEAENKYFAFAVKELEYEIENMVVFNKFKKCVGRFNIQVKMITDKYKVEGLNAQKPIQAVFSHLNILNRAFQRMKNGTIDACTILPTLETSLAKWGSFEDLVLAIRGIVKPGNTLLWLDLLDGARELHKDSNLVFIRKGCIQKQS